MVIPFNIKSQLFPFSSPINENGDIDTNSITGISVLASNQFEPSIVVCGSSDGHVCLVDLNKSLPIQRCNGHEKAITDISFLPLDPQLIISSSRDGTASIFDSRLPPDVSRVSRVRLTLDHEEADVWTIDAGGSSERLLACSNAEKILIYDIRVLTDNEFNDSRRKKRSDGLVWIFQDSHTDIVNCVRFHPSKRHLLASGADDNLLCIHDTNKCHRHQSTPMTSMNSSCPNSDNDDGTSDDPTFIGGLNTESPSRIIRFAGPELNVLCSISTTESIQAWHCSMLSKQNSTNSFKEAVRSYSTSSVSKSPFPTPLHTELDFDEDFSCHRLIAPTYSVLLAPQLVDDESRGYVVNVIYDDSTERLFALGGKEALIKKH